MRNPLELEILRKLFPEKKYKVDLFPQWFMGAILSWRMVIEKKDPKGNDPGNVPSWKERAFANHVGETPKEVSRTVLESIFRFRQAGRKSVGKVFRKEDLRKVLPGKTFSFLENLRKAYSGKEIWMRFKVWTSGKVSVASFRFRRRGGNGFGQRTIAPICLSGRTPLDATRKVLGEIFLRMGVSGIEEAELKMESTGWDLPENMS